jgi:hypothetical protein
MAIHKGIHITRIIKKIAAFVCVHVWGSYRDGEGETCVMV